MERFFRDWSGEDLERASIHIDNLLHDCRLLQAKRMERGAWVKPGLADSATQLEKALLASYDRLAREVIASLSGRADDVSSGRLLQAKKGAEASDVEMDEAIDHYGLPDFERDTPLDRSRLAAVLALLLLWRRRHGAIVEAKAKEMFAVGRKKALAEVGKKTLAEGPISKGLEDGIVAKFDGDIDRLESGLRDGTSRNEGLEEIVKGAPTVGWAAAYLRRLFDAEQFRIGMLAEALVWRAWFDGYRAGAIESTRSKLQENGVHLVDDLEVSDLSETELEGISFYEWVGPDDERTCANCSEQFGEPVIAIDELDLPDPISICLYKQACRHWWQLNSY
jgi:hypothetical protein